MPQNPAAAVAALPPASDPWAGHPPADCVGVDEVGRGALFGPVFAAAVCLPPQALTPLAAAGLTDSKKLSARRRQALLPLIRAEADCWAIGQASAAEIDRHGIRLATEWAMRRALLKLRPIQLLLVDGVLPLRGWDGPQYTLVGGDSRCPAIAAASVLAKQERDGLLQRLAMDFPGYGLERHAGYGTAQHRQAIAALGPTRLHRLSFLRSAGTTAGNRRAAAVPPVC